MRLFIAIEFPDAILSELEAGAARIRPAFLAGRFPPRENYHLTLAFLGELPERCAGKVTAAMDRCRWAPIPLTIGCLGSFKRRDGHILWRSVEAPEALYRLQDDLSAALREAGFPLEEREYRPHLTLARGARLREGVTLQELSGQLPSLAYTAPSMTLMRSEHLRGRRVYTPLHRTSFGPGPISIGRADSPGIERTIP